MNIETLALNEPVGNVPNNTLPLVIYRDVVPAQTTDVAAWLEQRLAANHWPAQWRYPIYDFTHFHSNCHELLAVFSGRSQVQFGGESGPVVTLAVGDVVLIPAGVGHKAVASSGDFEVLGAYPSGVSADLCRDDASRLAQVSRDIAAVPIPATDPLTGERGGITTLWHNPEQA